MKLTRAALAACLAASATAAPAARAEVTRLTVAQQYGVSFLPLMVMEREKLVEKRAREAGLGDLTVEWIKVAGPSLMNDGLVSGSLHFAAQGAPSLITLWDKTGSIKAMSALTTYPLYLNTRNPDVKSVKDFGPKDRIAVPSIKVSTQAILLQMEAARVFGQASYARLDPLTVGLSHPDGTLAMANGSVTAHYTSSPFHEQQLKMPGVHTLLTSYDTLGGPATAIVLTTSEKFRTANPRAYRAFLDGVKDAIAFIYRDKLAAAKLYLELAKDTKTSPEEIVKTISDPSYEYTLTPHKVFKTAEFMHRIGTIKRQPASWKDLFFPEIHDLPGD